MKKQVKSSMKLHGHFKAVLRDAATGEILKVVEKDNLLMNVAKNGFAGILNGESGFTGEINYLAVGTGANTPVATDTQLQTELARTTIVPSSNVRTNNVLTMEFYFDPTQANGNIKEVGVFINGTALANSGFLFDRTLLDIVKALTNSLTITFTVTVT